MPLNKDYLNQTRKEVLRQCKSKRLIPSNNSYFLQVTCPYCANIRIVFSRASTQINCLKCTRKLAEKTGSKIKLLKNVEFIELEK